MKSKTTAHPKVKIDPERWHRLKDILADALDENSPAARTALVEARCANDAALLAEAESLVNEAVALQTDPIDSLEECAEHATVTLWQDEAVPAGWRIGAYVVTRELGRGGMGSVYLAARADGQFEKEVAIKILKRGTDTDEVLHRFSSERHILARLDHPNIARLLDAGTTDDGLPYFVMEYVAGAPVTRFAREHELSIDQRLAVFLKICAAVEVAHHNRVIHRDLKPSNILVNAEGEPKLLDFGIAKLLTPGQEGTEITAANEQRLTPICASPEQTDGRPITEASDVYAPGALLYEMLSGQKPHKFSSTHPSHDEIARVVREQEPLPPSTNANAESARLLRGDLDAIVLKALRKDPAMRYPTVSELAADVRRHVARQPIFARGPGVRYRAATLIGDRRRALVAGVGVILVISALLFVLLPRFQPRIASPGVLPNETLAAADSQKSIAVLPFDNFGNDNPSYFADGVQDNILTDLGKVSDLKVVSRNAVAAYRGKTRNAKEIGRELGVGNVLVGSVQKSGDRVRINAQLIDTRTDTQIWAEHYDRSVADIFALQSELAQTIVAQLKATLSTGEKAAIWKRPTEDLEAYDLYLRARSALNEARGPDPKPNWGEAVQYSEAALARDSKFTRAYCLLSQMHLLIYRFGNDHSAPRLAAAKSAADTALRLEPDLEETRLAQARYYYDGLSDYRRTEKELSMIPSSAPHQVAFVALASLVERRLGKWKETIRDGQKAIDLDPQNGELSVNLCQTYTGLRRFDDSNRVADAAIARAHGSPPVRLGLAKNEAALGVGDVEGARAALDAFPNGESMDYESARLWLCLVTRDYPGARVIAAKASEANKSMPTFWLMMGAVAQADGKAEEARQAYEEAKRSAETSLVQRSEDAELLGDLASAEAALGLYDEALRHARRAMEIMPLGVDALIAPRCEMRLAEVLAAMGDRDGAMKILSEMVKKPFGLNYGDLKLNPMWDRLRDHPRFAQLLEDSTAPIPIDG